MPLHRHDPKVFFPWERRRGLGAVLRRARGQRAIVATLLLVTFVLVHQREQRAAQVRATRTTISETTMALAAFRADHEERCPVALSDLVASGYLHELPRDAWGRPLRVACPGRAKGHPFDVASDGPDGEPLGLDRVQ
jgi:general secretion pathway protein G